MSDIIFKQIELQNFLSFTKSISLCLEKQGTICIEGLVKDKTGNTSNGAGKSTIAIESLYWALTGETLRGLKGDDVINKFVGKDTYVFLTIVDGAIEYVIQRYRGHKVYKNNLYLYVKSEKELASVTKATTVDTQNYIYQILGTSKDVLRYTVFSSPNLIESFSTKTDMQQKALLENILSVIETGPAQRLAKIKINEASAAINSKIASIEAAQQAIAVHEGNVVNYVEQDMVFRKQKEDDVIKLTADNETLAIQKIEKEDIITEVQIAIKAVEQDLKNAESKQKQLLSSIDSVREEAAKYDKQLYTTEAALQEQKEKLAQVQNELQTQKSLLNIRPTEEGGSTLEDYEELFSIYDRQGSTKSYLEASQDLITEHTTAIKKLESENIARSAREQIALKEIQDLQHKIDNCETMREDVLCESCGNTVTAQSKQDLIDLYSKRKEAEQQLIKSSEANRQLADQEIAKLEDSISALNQSITKFKQVEELKQQQAAISTISSTITELQTVYNDVLQLQEFKKDAMRDIREENQTLEVSIQAHRDAVRELSKDLPTIQIEVSKLTSQIDSNRTQIDLAKTAISPYIELIQRSQAAIVAKEEEKRTLDSTIKEYEEILKYYKFWEVGFSNRGIKSYIFDLYTPLLNEYTSHYLSILTKGTVSVTFSTQTTLKSGEVREKFSIDIENAYGASTYEGSSRGQRQRIDLAITLALYKISQLRSSKKIKYLALDEIDDGVDDAGIEQIIDIINELSTEVETLFVLSHKSAMKAYFDKVITVVYQGKQSSIEK